MDMFDLVGVGFGPANIALAVALEERGWTGRTLFLERSTAPDWQSEMMIEGSDIQHNPLRDFVTPRNPTSAYGFLSFLKSQGRLFDYLNLDAPYALRKDYAAYVRWVARHFDRWALYGESVASIEAAETDDGAAAVAVTTTEGRRVFGRALSVAPGRSPLVPPVFEPYLGDRVSHFSRYLTSIARWQAEGGFGSIAVLGASQSAVEIILDLSRRFPDVQIHSVQRGFGFHLKDVSPFIEKAYYPEFVDYYHGLSGARQRAVTADLWRSNYGAADSDVIHQLHLAIYEQKLDGRERIALHTNADVMAVSENDVGIKLHYRERNTNDHRSVTVDAVILATGFRNSGSGDGQERIHPLLSDLEPHFEKREDGSLSVTRDYRLRPIAHQGIAPVFLNGLNESTHGFGDAGSFSLLALRSNTIAESIASAFGARDAVSVSTSSAELACAS